MFHLEPLHPFEDAIVIAHVAQPAWREEKNKSVEPEKPAPTHRHDCRMTTLLLPRTLSLPKDTERIIHANQIHDNIPIMFHFINIVICLIYYLKFSPPHLLHFFGL